MSKLRWNSPKPSKAFTFSRCQARGEADGSIAGIVDYRFSSLLSRVAGSSTGEDRHLRLRKEVETCEERYKTSISQLDVLR